MQNIAGRLRACYNAPVAVVSVFASSHMNPAPAFRRAASELGRRLARAGHTVRTGAGASPCLMGLVSDAALAAGGRVEGVILDRFLHLQHPKVPTRIEKTMAERKRRLWVGTRALVVLPGGYGTLDELFEVLVLHQIGLYRGRVILINVDRFYDPLLAWLKRAGREGFIKPVDRRRLSVVKTAAAAMAAIRAG